MERKIATMPQVIGVEVIMSSIKIPTCPSIALVAEAFLVYGSLHTGGSQVLLADGSVRFLSENIDTTTRQNLHYRADGRVLGEF